MTSDATTHEIQRKATLTRVRLGDMAVSALGQRKLRPSRVNYLIATLDLEKLGAFTVNWRDGKAYLVDGQHRQQALLGSDFDPDYTVDCWTYIGLTEQEEADMFLGFADVLTINGFEKFGIAVVAGYPVETDIAKIVDEAGLRITRDDLPGAVHAVGTLRRIYVRGGDTTLRRTLAVARDAFGDPGMEAVILDGLALLLGRYGDKVDDAVLVAKLANLGGGAKALSAKAEILRQRVGKPKGQCVAAVAVGLYNSGRVGPRVTPWWKEIAA